MMDYLKKHQTAVLLIVLWILTLAAYFNVIDGEFQFDDYLTITTNLSIKNIENLSDPKNFSGILSGQRFITDVTFAVNYYYDRLNPRGYHLVSIALHYFTACLVFVLARRLGAFDTGLSEGRARLFAFLASAVFALHPVNTAAVSYISQRAEILSTFFFLLALYVFLKSLDSRGAAGRVLLSGGVVINFILSLWSKLTTISFPALLFLTDILATRGRSLVKRIPLYAAVAAVAILIGYNFMSGAGASHDIGYSLERIDLQTYILTQFRVILTYIRLLFLPINQNLDYDYRLSKGILEWDTGLSLLFILGLLLYAAFAWKRRPVVAFGIFWFFLTLSPTSSVVPVIDVIFEHRVYLPSFGFSLVAASLVLKGSDLLASRVLRATASDRTAGMITLVLLCAMVIVSANRNMVWQSKISLWADVIEKSPNKPRAYMNYGQALSEKGFYRESIDVLSRGLQCKDDGSVQWSELYRELGVSYYKAGDLEEAIKAYRNGRHYAPKDPTLLNNLSIALYDRGEYDQAQMYAEMAVQSNPVFPDVYNTIGNIHFRKGDYEKALTYFMKGRELNPDVPLSYWNLGLTYEYLGDLPSAAYYLKTFVSMVKDESQRNQGLMRLEIVNGRLGRRNP